jgi:hypothetical protein
MNRLKAGAGAGGGGEKRVKAARLKIQRQVPDLLVV